MAMAAQRSPLRRLLVHRVSKGRRVTNAFIFVAVACLVLAIKFRAFRYIFLAMVGILVVWLAVDTANWKQKEEDQKQEKEAEKYLVSADQLVFTDLAMGPYITANYGPASAVPGRYWVTGRIKNTSLYTVSSIKAKIRISDCDAQSHCEVVGEDEDYIDINTLIPPGQVRDVNSFPYFGSDTRVHGHFQWNYQITEIRAR